MNIKISPTLANLETVDYRELKDFQGNLKDLTEKHYNKLKKSIGKQFDFPFFVWRDSNNNNWIFDGHQRHRVLSKELATPYELPCIFIDAKDEKEAKKKLLALNSQYGTMTKEGFDEFTFDFEPFELDELYEISVMDMWKDAISEESETKEETEKNQIVLNYTIDEYLQVKEALSKLAQTPEQAVYSLLFQRLTN
jgi:hypothetical protein